MRKAKGLYFYARIPIILLIFIITQSRMVDHVNQSSTSETDRVFKAFAINFITRKYAVKR